jgi:hypothetical protein
LDSNGLTTYFEPEIDRCSAIGFDTQTCREKRLEAGLGDVDIVYPRSKVSNR